jgi:hypothetical protein
MQLTQTRLIGLAFRATSPARFTADAARYLPNSIHVVAPGGRVPDGPCIDAMERAFLDAANPRVVDTSCVASVRIPDFLTNAAAPQGRRRRGRRVPQILHTFGTRS